MKLLKLTLEGYAGVPDGTYSFADPSTGTPYSSVLITGPAASGKTRLLEAVCVLKEHIGAYGSAPSPKAHLRPGCSQGRITGELWLTETERSLAACGGAVLEATFPLGDNIIAKREKPAVQDLFSATAKRADVGRFMFFPTSRHLGDGSHHVTLSDDSRGWLTADRDKLAGVMPDLAKLVEQDGARALQRIEEEGVLSTWDRPDSLAPLRDLIAQTLPHLRLGRVFRKGHKVEVFFHTEGGGEIPLTRLSHSEQDVVLFASVLGLLGFDDSVVLIDQPDLFMAEDRQVEWIEHLLSLGKDNQLIFTSQSSALSAGIPAKRQIILPRRQG